MACTPITLVGTNHCTPTHADLKSMHKIPLGSKTLAPGIVFCPIQAPLPLGNKSLALPISAI